MQLVGLVDYLQLSVAQTAEKTITSKDEILKKIQELYEHEYKIKTRSNTKSLEALKNMHQHGEFLLLVNSSVLSTASTSTHAETNAPNELIGFVYLSGSKDDPLLEDIIIDSKHRHRSLGSKLLQLSLQHSSIQLAPHVDLYCMKYLLPFYVKNNFVVVRESETDRCYLRWTRPVHTSTS
jgi:hypothetical protein